jgi:hypothetical protein
MRNAHSIWSKISQRAPTTVVSRAHNSYRQNHDRLFSSAKHARMCVPRWGRIGRAQGGCGGRGTGTGMVTRLEPQPAAPPVARRPAWGGTSPSCAASAPAASHRPRIPPPWPPAPHPRTRSWRRRGRERRRCRKLKLFRWRAETSPPSAASAGLPPMMPSSSASLGTLSAGFDEDGRRSEGACESMRRRWGRRGGAAWTKEMETGAGEVERGCGTSGAVGNEAGERES